MTSTADIDRSDSQPASPIADLPTSLDAISLEQALLDFEVANARVIDLTRRLVEATHELDTIRHEVELLRPEAEAARGSRLFNMARKARKLARFIRQ